MSFASRFNRVSKFDVKTDGYEYMSLKDLQEKFPPETVFILSGLYINKKSMFGDAPLVTIRNPECFVNLPSHLLGNIIDMIADDEVVEAIKAGRCGFTIYEYEDKKFKRLCYGVKWVDV